MPSFFGRFYMKRGNFMNNQNYQNYQNNQNYPNQGQNFQQPVYQNAWQGQPQPPKKKKWLVPVIIAVIVAVLAVAGVIIWKVVSEDEDSGGGNKDRKPYSGSSYVVKSKLTAANSAATSLSRSIDTVMTELDEEGIDALQIEYISYSKGDDSVEVTGKLRGVDEEELYQRIREYFNDVEKLDFVAKIEAGICIAAISTSDDLYWGTYPTTLTLEDYREADSALTLEEVMDELEDKLEDKYGNECKFDDYQR